MMSKSFYQLLEIPPTATLDTIKRAFRLQIARYHPDKVQHLGKEFQDMAAERAAELTEAYRILSDEQRRAAYDRALAAPENVAAGFSDPGSAARKAVSRPAPGADPAHSFASSAASGFNRGAEKEAFSRERATRDHVVRRATFGRVRQALDAIGGYDPSAAQGFDVAWLPKSRLFTRGKGPRLAGRLVPRIDADSIAGACSEAGRWAGSEHVCVFLMGTDLAATSELARAVADQRRRSGSRVTVIPVDARTWEAHLPVDAPAVVKRVLDRLKTGT
jgi:curved DNA-binding protein CbpA